MAGITDTHELAKWLMSKPHITELSKLKAAYKSPSAKTHKGMNGITHP